VISFWFLYIIIDVKVLKLSILMYWLHVYITWSSSSLLFLPKT
jgi:hypothetical protein